MVVPAYQGYAVHKYLFSGEFFWLIFKFRRKLNITVSDSGVYHLCLGKSKAMSVGTKIVTMFNGKSVPRTDIISDDTKSGQYYFENM